MAVSDSKVFQCGFSGVEIARTFVGRLWKIQHGSHFTHAHIPADPADANLAFASLSRGFLSGVIREGCYMVGWRVV